MELLARKISCGHHLAALPLLCSMLLVSSRKELTHSSGAPIFVTDPQSHLQITCLWWTVGNHDKIENLNRPITSKVIESVTKNLPRNKSTGSDSYTGAFCQTFKDKLITIFLKLFPKKEEEGTLPKSFYKACIRVITKPDKNATRKENYRSIPLMNINAKILNKMLANQIQQYI